MTATEALLWAATLAPGVIVAAARAVWGRHPPAPTQWLGIWASAVLVGNVMSVVMAWTGHHTLWMRVVIMPVLAVLTVLTLAHWHRAGEVRRLAYRLCAALAGAVAVVALSIGGPERVFDTWLGAFMALIALAAALDTLVSRSLASAIRLVDCDWFWAGLGFALYWTTYTPLWAFVHELLARNPSDAVNAMAAQSLANLLTYGLMTWGVLTGWPRRR